MLLPLLLFQFTIVAGLLMVAGVLPWIVAAYEGRSPPPAVIVLSVLCMVLGCLVRPNMAVLVLVCMFPSLVVAHLMNFDRSRLLHTLLYFGLAGMVALSAQLIDRAAYGGESALARAWEYQQRRAELNNPSTESVPVPNAAGLQWSRNEDAMLKRYMAMDSGPFSLSVLRQLTTRLPEPHVSDESAQGRSASTTIEKVTGILEGRSLKHLRLTAFLFAVLLTPVAIAGGMLTLRDKRGFVLVAVAAIGVAFGCVLTAVVMDRAVFRVLLPCIFALLAVSVAVFPGERLGTWSALPQWRRLLLSCAVGIGVLSLVLGSLIGISQISLNSRHSDGYRNLVSELTERYQRFDELVMWSTSLPLEFQSPFEPLLAFDAGFHQIDWHSSLPGPRASLTSVFGADIYGGLVQPDVAHLVSADGDIERLRRLAEQQYGRRISARQIGVLEVDDRQTQVWAFDDTR
ncbi:MAG: hypothetical protein QNJ73_07235 [Gammaproteobacteria bacterium]|nr:hypothetical protein [Gammaproteobacteria bacterium]